MTRYVIDESEFDLMAKLRAISNKIISCSYAPLANGRFLVTEIETTEPLTETELRAIQEVIGFKLKVKE